jgi:hypothetical protein
MHLGFKLWSSPHLEGPSFGGEPEVLLPPLDEQRLQVPLQIADCLADGGLVTTVDLRGLGEAFSFAQIAKNFQRFHLHKWIE